MSDFSKRLKDLRMQKDMTQEDVASKLYVTKQAVSKWENDNSLPDVATLGRLAELFDVNIDYLLTGNENIKVVEKETVVEKEKLVEVEKPLTEQDLYALQLYHFEYWRRYFGAIFGAIMFYLMTFMFLIFTIRCFVLKSKMLMPLCLIMLFAFGILGTVAVILAVKNKGKYKAAKKEVEEKAGKEIGWFYFKD